ncbi:MAG: tRNA-binding protein, partial [Pseudomonadota bacterium]
MHKTFDADSRPEGTTSFDTFMEVDIRVGTVIEAQPFPEARKPSL